MSSWEESDPISTREKRKSTKNMIGNPYVYERAFSLCARPAFSFLCSPQETLLSFSFSQPDLIPLPNLPRLPSSGGLLYSSPFFCIFLSVAMAIQALSKEIERLFALPDATPQSITDDLQKVMKEYP